MGWGVSVWEVELRKTFLELYPGTCLNTDFSSPPAGSISRGPFILRAKCSTGQETGRWAT